MKINIKLYSLICIFSLVIAGCNLDTAAVKMTGSTSMEKLANTLKEAYYAEKGIEIDCQFTGSSAGIEAVKTGIVDIGNVSRRLKDEEKLDGIVENIVAFDGIVIVINKDNTLDDISSEDLARVYTGEVTNWKQLGGGDQPIILLGREAGSGTRDAFEELLNIKDYAKYAQEINSTGAVIAKIQTIPGAIGYVSLDVINEDIKVLSVNKVAPTVDNILMGQYILQRPFVMATKGELALQNQDILDLFDYFKSESGKKVIEHAGLIYPN